MALGAQFIAQCEIYMEGQSPNVNLGMVVVNLWSQAAVPT